MGLIDRLDAHMTNGLTRRQERINAHKFAAQFRTGDRIRVTRSSDVREYTVGRGGRVGSDTVAGLYLRADSVEKID